MGASEPGGGEPGGGEPGGGGPVGLARATAERHRGEDDGVRTSRTHSLQGRAQRGGHRRPVGLGSWLHHRDHPLVAIDGRHPDQHGEGDTRHVQRRLVQPGVDVVSSAQDHVLRPAGENDAGPLWTGHQVGPVAGAHQAGRRVPEVPIAGVRSGQHELPGRVERRPYAGDRRTDEVAVAGVGGLLLGLDRADREHLGERVDAVGGTGTGGAHASQELCADRSGTRPHPAGEPRAGVEGGAQLRWGEIRLLWTQFGQLVAKASDRALGCGDHGGPGQ